MLGLRYPGFKFRILCLEGSVISLISPSSGGSVCAQKWPKARLISLSHSHDNSEVSHPNSQYLPHVVTSDIAMITVRAVIPIPTSYCNIAMITVRVVIPTATSYCHIAMITVRAVIPIPTSYCNIAMITVRAVIPTGTSCCHI